MNLNRAFAGKFARNAFFIICALLTSSYFATRLYTHIDLALYGYMVGTVVFVLGFLYRFMAWAERPPTKTILKKGWKKIRSKKTAGTSIEHLITHKFIWNRGWYRWTQHMLLCWGCVLSAFVTFPLVFGWMYFTMSENGTYTIVAMGLNVMSIDAEGWLAYLFYNALNITAFMVIAGVSMALYRRIKNMQARAEQSFIFDFLPLYMLLFVSVTGLMLTASNIFLHGFAHPVISIIHQWSVILTLIYIPFGKLAHFPFRPMSVLAKNYRDGHGSDAMKACKVCGTEFVSIEQSGDVIDVLKQSGIEFKQEDGFHLAELCLPCRRKFRMSKFSGVPTHLSKYKEANQNAKG